MSDIRRPPTGPTSLWPAATVLVTAIVVLGLFLALNIVASPKVTRTTNIPIIVGGLALDPHNDLAATACNDYGIIPENITSSLVLPVETTLNTHAHIVNGGAGDFDCGVNFGTTAGAGRVLGFFDAHLGVRGWKLFSRGANKLGQDQLLFQKAGTDGFYWVLGITVLAAHPGHTVWALRVYQNSETI
jgi:hypothetical protein